MPTLIYFGVQYICMEMGGINPDSCQYNDGVQYVTEKYIPEHCRYCLNRMIIDCPKIEMIDITDEEL